jgi:hypothetical protein
MSERFAHLTPEQLENEISCAKNNAELLRSLHAEQNERALLSQRECQTVTKSTGD